MKKTLLVLVSLLFTACSHLYYEPPVSSNNAILEIEVEHPFEFNTAYGMEITAELDGKLIHRARYPNLKVRTTAGTHKLAVGVTAYYYNRAKYYFTKEYEVNFKPNEKYTISAKVKSKTLKSRTDNIDATLYVNGEGLNILNSITLEDNMMRSMVCQAPCVIPVVIPLQ